VCISIGSHFLHDPHPKLLVMASNPTVQRVGQILRQSVGQCLRLDLENNEFSPFLLPLLGLYRFLGILSLNDLANSTQGCASCRRFLD